MVTFHLKTEYYWACSGIDATLPLIFSVIADMAQWIMQRRGNAEIFDYIHHSGESTEYEDLSKMSD